MSMFPKYVDDYLNKQIDKEIEKYTPDSKANHQAQAAQRAAELDQLMKNNTLTVKRLTQNTDGYFTERPRPKHGKKAASMVDIVRTFSEDFEFSEATTRKLILINLTHSFMDWAGHAPLKNKPPLEFANALIDLFKKKEIPINTSTSIWWDRSMNMLEDTMEYTCRVDAHHKTTKEVMRFRLPPELTQQFNTFLKAEEYS